jgi:hypothetical protein
MKTELDHSKLDCSEVDRAEPNEGLHCKIMCNLRSSEKILHSIEGSFHTTFQDILKIPASRVKKSKREKRA